MIAHYFLPLKSEVNPMEKGGGRWMLLIAMGRLGYGVILLMVGVAIFNLIGKNLDSELSGLISRWHLGSHIYYVHWLLQKASNVSPELLMVLMAGNFIYAALAFIEAAGLGMGRRWAYWLVIFDTASFIPIEVYQLYAGFSWGNLGLLIFYIASVVYLVRQITRRRQLTPGFMVAPMLKSEV
jgi:uncharacterized membrane protein (DUF2068 family)